MKKIITVQLIMLCLWSCKEKKNEIKQESLNTKGVFATKNFLRDFDAIRESCKTNKIVLQILDSIKTELPQDIDDLKYFDSAKGLHIDFYGQEHLGTFDNENKINTLNCQSKINTTIINNHYYCVGDEGSSVQGEINFLNHSIETNRDIIFNNNILGTKMPLIKEEEMVKMLEVVGRFECLTRYILNPKKGLKIIGTEPAYVWQSQCLLMRYYSNDYSSEVLRFFSNYFSVIRSEVALARTIKYLVKTKNQDKKALLVYGYGHLSDLTRLAKQYGIVSESFSCK